jgi:pyridoxine kinase
VPTVLILSSHVAASRVGGGAQVATLARIDVRSILVPTVLFGRHPGLGAPGGGVVPPEMFEGMIEGVEASGALAEVDAMITGYFADAGQVRTAARLIDALRATRPAAWIVVDPIMGDHGTGLYVSEAVAAALRSDLAPRADLIAPNAWEFQRLAAHSVTDVPSALAAATALAIPVLVSSIEANGEMGVMYVNGREAWLATHARQVVDPKGAGDLLTALFVGATVRGAAPRDALLQSVGQIAAIVAGAPVAVEVATL